jgi:hypothetical protein
MWTSIGPQEDRNHRTTSLGQKAKLRNAFGRCRHFLHQLSNGGGTKFAPFLWKIALSDFFQTDTSYRCDLAKQEADYGQKEIENN